MRSTIILGGREENLNIGVCNSIFDINNYIFVGVPRYGSTEAPGQLGHRARHVQLAHLLPLAHTETTKYYFMLRISVTNLVC